MSFASLRLQYSSTRTRGQTRAKQLQWIPLDRHIMTYVRQIAARRSRYPIILATSTFVWAPRHRSKEWCVPLLFSILIVVTIDCTVLHFVRQIKPLPLKRKIETLQQNLMSCRKIVGGSPTILKPTEPSPLSPCSVSKGTS